MSSRAPAQVPGDACRPLGVRPSLLARLGPWAGGRRPFRGSALLAGCGGSSSPSRPSLESILKRPGPRHRASPRRLGVRSRSRALSVPRDRQRARSPSNRPHGSSGSRAQQQGCTFAQRDGSPRADRRPGPLCSPPSAASRGSMCPPAIPRPGRYWLVAQPAGAQSRRSATMDVARAPPALPSAPRRRGRRRRRSPLRPRRQITTSRPPDVPLLRYSVADSSAAHRPFVVTFATPKFCTSRTCGPVVDVVDAVRRRLAGRGVRFIHVEVFRDNDPSRGYNRWMRQWGLASEPWIVPRRPRRPREREVRRLGLGGRARGGHARAALAFAAAPLQGIKVASSESPGWSASARPRARARLSSARARAAGHDLPEARPAALVASRPAPRRVQRGVLEARGRGAAVSVRRGRARGTRGPGPDVVVRSTRSRWRPGRPRRARRAGIEPIVTNRAEHQKAPPLP